MNFRDLLLIGCAGAAIVGVNTAAAQTADAVDFDIPSQPLSAALTQFAQQSKVEILFSSQLARDQQAPAVRGEMAPDAALGLLLAQSGLNYRATPTGSFVIEAAQAPQSGSAAGDGADGTVETLIVTAQKREEDIQDVPIAISAFTQEALERSQIAGGPDLITQVPNMTFTKTNFSSYSIQLRGIGTQAISATTDPAVAVAFNNTPFIRNRFFEQEFYDLQRVEVLRGPQGTLYGRNATAGVVNIISEKPKFNYEAKLSGDVANYNSTRLEGMVNIPLVEDKVALRLAGAWTKRDGYATNELTGNPIDGRDLWSTRVSLRLAPNDRFDANLIYEHFEEDDDRLRSGKQLCKTHVVTQVGSTPVTYFQGFPGAQNLILGGIQGTFSQGCERNSLYHPDSFQTPNGISLPYYHPLGAVGLPTAGHFAADGPPALYFDPYLSRTQSHDLRVIESTVDPRYRAKNDLFEVQFAFDVTDNLTLTSETAWASDTVFSTQDFNRFSTAPGAFDTTAVNISGSGILDENGVFCDPQIGCSDRLVAVDLSTARSRQFSQEIRLASDYEGPFNFSLGANFLRADSFDKYYVFINTLSMISAIGAWLDGVPWVPGVTDGLSCLPNGPIAPDPTRIQSILGCTSIDPNPIGSLTDQGHNYFLSNNPYKLISYAVFGEAYYNIADNLKITAGLRWTVDKKEAPLIPSWLLADQTSGYPVARVIEQEWREPTGRLTIDWKPDLAFTDETMIYGSYAHGYKAGGTNPPPYGIALYLQGEAAELTLNTSATRPRTFEPEFIDAFEIGSKNTLMDGAVTLNLAAFYYDYKDYQISEIVDRSAFNRNFDATVWGIEVEADWRPLENLKLGFKGGFESTRIADGERAIDLMDRTAGEEGWMVARPFPSIPSNCILPSYLWEMLGPGNGVFRVGNTTGGTGGPCEYTYLYGHDPLTNAPYVPNPVGSGPDGAVYFNGAYYPDYPGFNPLQPAINNGEGFFKQLGGNELPNAPNLTGTFTVDYTIPLPNDWLATLHTDLYWQSESWWRIFNDHEYNKLDEYFTMNLAAIFTNEERGWKVMAYVKNVFDRDSITGAFLNSDDTGLTTNVFLTEPRLYGLRVTKEWTGGPLLGSFGARNSGPAAFTVELGGQVQRHEAPYETVEAGFEEVFPEQIRIFDQVQNRDLDWGDGREARVTWRPGLGPWTVSAGLRYGRTNNDTTRLHAIADTPEACGFAGKYAALAFACDRSNPGYPVVPAIVNRSATIWSAPAARDREEHDLVDFAVGRDFDIGGLSRSEVAAGIRYAAFESKTHLELDGVPDRYIEAGWLKYGGPFIDSIFHQYDAVVEAAREFKGTGPVVSWDAALALLGNEDAGLLEIDWSVSGGALFGEQETAVDVAGTVAEKELQVTNNPAFDRVLPRSVDELDIPPVRRSEDVTVPVFAASLGLAYSIDRFRVGAGYRWERYFDVLDVGMGGHKDADRTIDGPYFKVSVGFGG